MSGIVYLDAFGAGPDHALQERLVGDGSPGGRKTLACRPVRFSVGAGGIFLGDSRRCVAEELAVEAREFAGIGIDEPVKELAQSIRRAFSVPLALFPGTATT